jgi:phosphoenolpyruvate carboxykinase (ATP)
MPKTMHGFGVYPSKYGLENHGFRNLNTVFWNLRTAALVEQAIERREGLLAHRGALVVRTGHHTGRSPNDKFVVKEPTTEDKIWWGPVNRPYDPERFESLYSRMMAYFQGSDVFVQDVFAGAHPKRRIPIRVITEKASHSLFTRQLFVRPKMEETTNHVPEFTIIVAPRFHSYPEMDHTNSEAFIIVHFAKKLVIIGGSGYAGEIKKSMFSVMQYLLPQEQVLSMHCSANVGREGDVALYFGLSGTGKTSLSADPERRLIGDDEHGWDEDGIFNFEGGCYAKCIRLDPEKEPQIFNAIQFGAVLENVTINTDTRHADFDDDSLTENSRAAYPLSFIDNSMPPGVNDHPKNIFFLTCDAFGILPPISRLSPEQAMYHFMAGYTAKLAGTEVGLTEPQATFSTCFGAPFLPLHPSVYAKLLGEKTARHQVKCWLVNTGWSGGPYGVCERMNIVHTRAMIRTALEGKLDEVSYRKDPVFGVEVPKECPDVPKKILNPQETWADPNEYEVKAAELAHRFIENFNQFPNVDRKIKAAGPVAG